MVLTRPWVLHRASPDTGTYPRVMVTKNLFRRDRRPWQRHQGERRQHERRQASDA